MVGVEISEQFRQQINPAVTVPQMMMRIDDRKLRFEDQLAFLFCEPGILRPADVTKPAWLDGLRHGGSYFVENARISRGA